MAYDALTESLRLIESGGALLHDRPAELPRGPIGSADVDPRVLQFEGSGGCRDGRATRLWRPYGRWINHSTLRVNADVARVAVGQRQVRVPWHGRVIVAWPGRRAQDIVLLDDGGAHLGRATLPSSASAPRRR